MDDQFDPPAVVDVIRSLANGEPVDWTNAKTGAADQSMHEMLDALHTIARIAEVHGATAPATADVPGPGDDHPRGWGPLTRLERVGEGSYGLVYRAWDSRLDRKVALKLLRQIDHDLDQDSGGRTVDEGRLLARVRHPNVVTVYGADHIDGRVGIWMEFVEGRTLEAILRDEGPLSAAEVMRIGIEVARGLSAVHGAGLVHRDIKAQNVMRQPNGRIVLMDFGAGFLTEAAAIPTLVGTPLYTAPEILAGQPATPRSDVYALGVLLYHLLTNRYPVTAATLDEVRHAHQRGDVTPIRKVARAVPRRLAAVIERAIEADPDRRFETPDQVAAALASAQAAPWRRMLLAAGVAAVAAILPAAWAIDRGMVDRGDRMPPAAPGMSARLVDWRFQWLFLGAPSPDGRWLSYTDARTGNLALLDLASGGTTLVTDEASFGGNRYVTSSRFSSDGARIAYSLFKDGREATEIRIVDLRTKALRTLLRDDSAEDATVLAWSHDGGRLLVRLESKDARAHLELVTAGGERRRVASLPKPVPATAAFSPDDRFLVYDAPASAEGSRQLHVLDTIDGNDRTLLTGAADDAEPSWVGGRVFFSSTRGGKRGLWYVPVTAGFASGEPALVSDQLASGFWSVGLTDTGAFYYAAAEGLSSVYTASLTSDLGIGTPVRLTAENSPALSPEWSPDGHEIAWVARPRQSGTRGATVRVRDVGRAIERELTPPFVVGVNLRWSPDGTRLLLRGANEKGGGVRMIDVSTGELLDSFLLDRTGDVAWAADGTAFFYIDVKARTIGKMNVASHSEQPIYRLPPQYDFERGIALSPANDRIAFAAVHGDAVSILVIPVSGGPATPLVTLPRPHRLALQQWTRDGAQLLFVRSRAIPGAPLSQEWQLWAVDRDGGAPRYLDFSMPNLFDVRPSPDGRQLVFSSSNAENRLRVVEHVFSTAVQQNRKPQP